MSDPTCGDGSGNDGNGPDPGEIGYDQCENEPKATFCDLDIENNVWVEGVVDLSASRQKRGICMLDTMSLDQVLYVLKHDPRARCDLPKVTSNQELRNLLTKVELLPTGVASDSFQKKANTRPDGIPYYNQFGGQPPYKPGSSK